MSRAGPPRVAVFRPDDARLESAILVLSTLGVDPIADPLLEISATGDVPRVDAEYVIFTSQTGARIVAKEGWEVEHSTLVAVGATTADALESAGYRVEVTPSEYSSTGLVDRLRPEVDGVRIEVARSDHGNPALLAGLIAAGAYVHETVLYALTRPAASGASARLAARNELDGALFTSSLTVRHFLEAAAEQGIREKAICGLDRAIVGAIGPPTRQTAHELGIHVDVMPDRADFETLAHAVVDRLLE